ncbi:MAG: ubiquinol-cytochrome c reductase iron-sulfur subunit, partial [Gaiellaceae bacterium]
LVLVRLPVSELRLPSDLHGYDAGGIVAYSKICTHAGCAVSLYRAPHVFPDTAPSRPALICPCHYSTFDPAAGAAVLFGPAGRPLPQLPLQIADDGTLRAGGTFSGPVGPSWWGVRSGRSRPR